jgi:hypothetical protein
VNWEASATVGETTRRRGFAATVKVLLVFISGIAEKSPEIEPSYGYLQIVPFNYLIGLMMVISKLP